MEAGAVAVVPRPPGLTHPGFEAAARELLQTVKLMSEIKVVRRRPSAWREREPGPPAPAVPAQARPGVEVVAIGASTGGPQALQAILSGLRQELSAPVLIVQHIAPGFVAGFVEWLAGASNFPLRIASAGEHPRPGHGYVAPDGCHLGVEAGPRLVLSDQAPENGFRPSVAYLFRSVEKIFGPRAVGVLLTGMGSDGVEELKALKDRGAVTIAQDEASSLIHGMPGAAIKLEAATYVLPPEDIAALLETWLGRSNWRPQ
jgi:two-component system chemotaxis response regulator CheB